MRGGREVQGRLRDGVGQGRPEDARLSRQLRMLAAAGRLPTLGRVPVGPHSRRAASIALRLLVVLLCLAAAGGAARATVSLLVRRWQQGATPGAPAETRAAARPPTTTRAVALARAPAPTSAAPFPSAQPLPPQKVEQPPVALSAPPTAQVAHQPAASRTAPRTLGAAGPSAREDMAAPARQLAAEADSLRRALVAFRARDDQEVLAILDGYQARFPRGVLSLEATRMRAQVLLRRGDRPGALRLLDQLPLSDAGQTPEMMVARAELRALGDRCREALSDFDRALGPAARLGSAERARALSGRASCRARTGDAAGAERDRQQYLREFPQGRAVDHPGRQP